MSVEKPIWGVDVSDHQGPNVDFAQLKREGYDFAFIKASEGIGWHAENYRRNVQAARAANMIAGAYHFLWGNDPARQAQTFLDAVGNPEGKMLCVDVETYQGQVPPRRSHLEGFLRELVRRVGTKAPIVVYSGDWYYKRPEIGNMDLAKLPGNIETRVWTTPDSGYVEGPGFGSALYQRMPKKEWESGFGGKKPTILQFSAEGRAAGISPLDVNAFAGDRAQLQSLAFPEVSRPPKPGPDNGKDDMPKERKEKTLEEMVNEAIAFGTKMIGAPYGTGWQAGTWPALSPLYSDIGRHDSAAWYREREIICSALVNVLRFEIADLPAVGRKQGDDWPGGMAAIGRHLAFAEGTRPYPPVENTPRGWLVFSPYLGPSLPMQGHIGICLGNGKVLEARVPFLSHNRTENEGSRALVAGGAKPYTRIIPPSLWLRK